MELPGLPAKGDVTDWRDAGGTFERFRELTEAAAPMDAAALSELRARWGLADERTESRGGAREARRTIGRSRNRSKASFRPCKPSPKTFSRIRSVPW